MLDDSESLLPSVEPLKVKIPCKKCGKEFVPKGSFERPDDGGYCITCIGDLFDEFLTKKTGRTQEQRIQDIADRDGITVEELEKKWDKDFDEIQKMIEAEEAAKAKGKTS